MANDKNSSTNGKDTGYRAFSAKRGSVMLFLLLLLLCALGLWPAAMAAEVTASWSYDYSTDPACSTTLTTNCVDHFEVLDLTTSRALIQSVPNPPNPTGVVNGIGTTFRLGAPYGARTIAVVAVAKDGSGNRVESDPAKAQVVVAIPPGAPQTFVISSR